MKNTIKILCLILLTTFSLSTWAGGVNTGIQGRAQPVKNRQAERNYPDGVSDVSNLARQSVMQTKTSTNGPAAIQVMQTKTSTNDPNSLKTLVLKIEKQRKEGEKQKEEFIRIKAIKCEGNACQVTPTGRTLLYDLNYPNPDYARKFQAFCETFNWVFHLNLSPSELNFNNRRPQPSRDKITHDVKSIINPPLPPKPKAAQKSVPKPEKKSIGQQLLAWMVKSLNIEKKETRIIDFTGETSTYSRLKSEDREALKEIAEQPKCPEPSCSDVVKNSLNKMKKHGVKEVYILSHSKGNILKRNYDKTDEILNPIDLIKHGQEKNIKVHIIACKTGLNTGVGGFKVPVSLAQVINYSKDNAGVLTAEEFQKGFAKIHGQGNFVTSIYHQERFEPDTGNSEHNIPLPQKFANALNQSIMSATVDLENKKTNDHQSYELIYPTSKTNQSTYIEEKENMNDTH